MTETPIWLTALLAIPTAFFTFFQVIIDAIGALFGGA